MTQQEWGSYFYYCFCYLLTSPKQIRSASSFLDFSFAETSPREIDSVFVSFLDSTLVGILVTALSPVLYTVLGMWQT